MDSEIIKSFIEEAESYIPTIRGGILLCQNEGEDISELEAAKKNLNILKGASAMIGLTEISQSSKEIEEDLKSFDGSSKLSEDELKPCLDKLTKLEEQISELQAGLGDIEIDSSSLTEESFEFNEHDEESESNSTPSMTEDSFEDFEIDDEMLEIFALEAQDHLGNINKNVIILEKKPNSREALMEIRRSAHTLKGSAGIVGLTTLSNLAHKLEDLLDYISDNNIESNDEIFHLLQSGSDCIFAVTNNESSKELTEKIDQTLTKFDELLEQLQNDKTINDSDKLSEKQTEVQNSKDVTSQNSKEAEVETDKKNKALPASTQHSNSVIRVSLDRLDDLVKLVGEMVFSRSVFEQRLFEMEQQIDELQNSTRRLRHSTGKLETNFDSGMPSQVAFNPTNSSPISSFTSLDSNKNFTPSQNDQEFDSLEFDQYTDFNQTTRELIETTNDTSSINAELDSVHNFLGMIFDSQKHVIDEMQEKLMSLRMVSFGTLTSRLQRTVRVTADEEEKIVDLIIEGENLEVDTQILDSLVDPILHLLRNAVAHGIEPAETRRMLGKNERGKITLRAYSEGTHIVLSITDDGRGISANSLKTQAVSSNMLTEDECAKLSEEETYSLVFLPGLTTANEISQISGRGVGMNIVKTNIERQKGAITIDSELQKGTTFTLRLPMALAVTRSLLVEAAGQIYAFPLKLVKHIAEIAPKNLVQAKDKNKLRLGDVTYSVSYLNELISATNETNELKQDVPLLLIDTVKNPCALVVDKIIKPQEIVIKPLNHPLKNTKKFLGATLLGDGSVIPVLDLVYLLDEQSSVKPKVKQKPPSQENEKLTVMIVDDSPSVRHINKTLVKNNDWIPIVAKDGLEALELLNSSNKLPDIILTDVEMPEMDGYELLASLKQLEKASDIPVVMITSRASDKHRRKAYDLGVSDYITKPYDDKILIDTITKLTD